MTWMTSAIERFFERQRDEGESSEASLDRMSREIKGTIFALITIFVLVALTSYLPLDSFNLFRGRLDQINNLGGIVGAAISEWFLGTVGAPGYVVVFILGWLTLSAFRGVSIKRDLPRIFGLILGACLTAVALHLLMQEHAPEASLWQGGIVGREVAKFLSRYFNVTGAAIIIFFGFLITAILTTGLSFTHFLDSLFNGEKSRSADDEEDSTPAPRVPQVNSGTPAAAAPAKKKKAKAKLKLVKNEDGSEEDSEKTEEIDLSALTGGEGDEGAAPAAEPGGFQPLIPFTGSYDAPSPRILKNLSSDAKKLSRGELKERANKIVEQLLSFQITGQITNISQGPVLVTYEFKPAAGMKLSKIAALQDDLGVLMGTPQLRVIAPIPGKTTVGIEVPRPASEVISLKDAMNEKQFWDKKLKLPIALGRTTDGVAVFGDLAAMPHLLVAGGTGSGKSVFVNSLITSLIFRLSPKELRMILVDPKMLELVAFDGLPHLVTNVITDNGIAFNALTWAVEEMERRYALMAKSGNKNIESYNEKQKGDGKIPFLVIIVDELADLMMSGGKDVEVAITRLAQKARAAGIHLVIATQRPSTDVVTGLIKANMPSRIAFKVPSGIDSRTVLDTGGAESLMGRGDSLMITPGVPLRRLHGTFITEEDLARVAKNIRGTRDFTKNYISFSSALPVKEKK